MAVKRAALALLVAALLPLPAIAGEAVVHAPAASAPAREPAGLKQALFSGGCFWGVEAVFSHVKGVTSAVSGYQGGSASTASYDRVSQGDTGHAESVRVFYDPAIIRYDDLLRIFFSVVIDPTQKDAQGPDSGTQYRSALVPLSDEQRRVATAYLAQVSGAGLWHGKIATRIEAFHGFYPAEPYHQDFMAHNPDHPYIRYWDAPKVAALQRLFPAVYKPDFTPR